MRQHGCPALPDLLRVDDPQLRRALWTWETLQTQVLGGALPSAEYAPLLVVDDDLVVGLDALVQRARGECSRLPGYEGVWQQQLADAVLFATEEDAETAPYVLSVRGMLRPTLLCIPLRGDVMTYGGRALRMVAPEDVPAWAYAYTQQGSCGS